MSDKKFLIKEIVNPDWEKELEAIGFDKSYRHKAVEKFLFKNLKIFSLSVEQANILKQTALSVGADCATNRNVVTGKADLSDVILSGSFSQLNKIALKLKGQPFELSVLADKITEQLHRKKVVPKLVGILNVTDDSFSDGGMYNTSDKACRHLTELIADGADIVDIGAESTKPGAKPVDAKKQLTKIIPILEYINKNNINTPISIDTRSSEVAEECLKRGVSIINDVSGLKFDEKLGEVVGRYNAVLILQHSLGNSINMVSENKYSNIMDDLVKDLDTQIQTAKDYGIKSIIIDPGIGFDKTREENFIVLNRIDELSSLNYPLMLGISRKSLLNMGNSSNEEKDIYTLALNTLAIEHNVEYLRVHNVKMHRMLLKTYLRNC